MNHMLLRLCILLFGFINSHTQQLVQYERNSPFEFLLLVTPKISSYLQVGATAQYNMNDNVSFYSRLDLDFKNYTLTKNKTINTLRMNDFYQSSVSSTPSFNINTATKTEITPFESKYIHIIDKEYLKIMTSDEIDKKTTNNPDPYLLDVQSAKKNSKLLLLKASSKMLNYNRTFCNTLLSFGISYNNEIFNKPINARFTHSAKLSFFAEMEIIESFLRPILNNNNSSSLYNTANKMHEKKLNQLKKIFKNKSKNKNKDYKDPRDNIIYKMKNFIKIGISITHALQLQNSVSLITRFRTGFTPMGLFCNYDKIGFPDIYIYKLKKITNEDIVYDIIDKEQKLSSGEIDKANKYFMLDQQKGLLRLRNLVFIEFSLGLKHVPNYT